MAVCELENGEMLDLPICLFPSAPKEREVYDLTLTQRDDLMTERKDRISSLFAKLKNK